MKMRQGREITVAAELFRQDTGDVARCARRDHTGELWGVMFGYSHSLSSWARSVSLQMSVSILLALLDSGLAT